jgi:RHS repeat-associated protein
MAQQVVTGGPTFDYVYSPSGRLATVKLGGTEVATYLYDYAGHRVSRTITATPQTIHYVYDKGGNVIAEHDGATGAMLREYVWLNDLPIALVTGSAPAPQYSYIHTGQIGEPLMVTDASQARQWDVASDPWGNALPLSTGTIAQDLRLPGQQMQAESGLFQNWHRDYDPTLGRYVEADPIGLAGGGNVFNYVNGSPLNRIDPKGLAIEYQSGRWIDCGAGCRIRIDTTIINGKRIRHLHWECKGRGSGECGENGATSHGGTWEDAPERIKECARRAGFNGQPSASPMDASTGPSNQQVAAGAAAVAVVAGVICALAEPCGAAVALALGLGGTAALAAQ